MRAIVGCVALVACERGGPGIDRERAAATFERVAIDTRGEHGLSGLAADDGGAVWSVAERGASVWKIRLDGGRAAAERFAVEGVPRGDDLEAIAVVPGGRLVVGTEGKRPGEARAYTLAPAASGYRVEATETLGDGEVGVAIGGNHGVEGACAIGAAVVLALESVGTDERGRWAPVVTIEGGARRVQRLRLTSDRGKLSGLDCWRDGERRHAIAIERHFEVTRLVTFELGGASDEIVPEVALDLAPVLRGALNLEGIARLPDGRVIAVVDNQYKTITGPDELLVFRDYRVD